MVIPEIPDFVIGVLSGFFLSVCYWIFSHYIFPPSIKFNDKITKRKYPDESLGYFILYKNTGKRKLIDPIIQVTVYIPGLVNNNPITKQLVFIENTGRDRLFIPTTKEFDGYIKSKLLLDESKSLKHNKLLPEDVLEKVESNTLTLDDLMDINAGSYLKVRIIGSDETTGVRKLFESENYSQNDIEEE